MQPDYCPSCGAYWSCECQERPLRTGGMLTAEEAMNRENLVSLGDNDLFGKPVWPSTKYPWDREVPQ